MKRLVTILTTLALLTGACGDDDGGTVRLMTHDSFAISDDVRAAFTEETGYELEILPSGDAGSMVNQAILTAGNPIADVLFGVDTTFLSRALDADLFVPYRSSELDAVRPGLAAGDLVTPIDFGDVCINYDRSAFGDDPPTSLIDLTDSRYAGMLVVQDPATSSPGLAFLLGTIATLGDGGWQQLWQGLAANDVEVAAGWEDA